MKSTGPGKEIDVVLEMLSHLARARFLGIGFTHDRIHQPRRQLAADATIDDRQTELERALDEQFLVDHPFEYVATSRFIQWVSQILFDARENPLVVDLPDDPFAHLRGYVHRKPLRASSCLQQSEGRDRESSRCADRKQPGRSRSGCVLFRSGIAQGVLLGVSVAPTDWGAEHTPALLLPGPVHFPEERVMHLNLGLILSASANENPDAIVIRAGDLELSYAELDRAARGVAANLQARGIAPGDKVALLVPNVPEFSIAYFGILYAGATVVPINILAAAPEVTYFLEDSDSRLLIVHPLFEEPGRRGAEPLSVPVVIAEGEDNEDTVAAMAKTEPLDGPHPTSPQDTAVILYTSGTTGKPKGAELTHSNLLMNCAVVVPKLMPPSSEGHRALATLPLFHSFGQTVIQNGMIATGGSITMLARFTPEEAFELIERDRLTVFAGVPTMYFGLLHHRGDRAYDVSSLEICMTGGAPMPVEVMNSFEEKFNVDILEGFGLSETSPISSFNILGKPRRAGSIGYPVWGVELCIVNDADELLPDDERGEICIRGHNIMKGYLNRPDATKETLRNGWFHSGDIGYRDSDGCYWIVDRKKDMILRGGFNVYPREVEEVLYQHEQVVEAAVIGVPHERHGEEVKAFVALTADAKATPEELQAFCKERLAAYKYPRSVEILAELPKGPTGKILKRELRDD